jgi:hypothetical protein
MRHLRRAVRRGSITRWARDGQDRQETGDRGICQESPVRHWSPFLCRSPVPPCPPYRLPICISSPVGSLSLTICVTILPSCLFFHPQLGTKPACLIESALAALGPNPFLFSPLPLFLLLLRFSTVQSDEPLWFSALVSRRRPRANCYVSLKLPSFPSPSPRLSHVARLPHLKSHRTEDGRHQSRVDRQRHILFAL